MHCTALGSNVHSVPLVGYPQQYGKRGSTWLVPVWCCTGTKKGAGVLPKRTFIGEYHILGNHGIMYNKYLWDNYVHDLVGYPWRALQLHVIDFLV